MILKKKADGEISLFLCGSVLNADDQFLTGLNLVIIQLV
jgi:hypothetical protein